MALWLLKFLVVLVSLACSFALGELLHWLGLTELIWSLEPHPHDSLAPAVWVLVIWGGLFLFFLSVFNQILTPQFDALRRRKRRRTGGPIF